MGNNVAFIALLALLSYNRVLPFIIDPRKDVAIHHCFSSVTESDINSGVMFRP